MTSPADHPGRPFGLPPEGPGSVAGWWRRIGGLFIDWFACLAIAGALQGTYGWEGPDTRALLPILVLFVEMSVLVGLLGTSLGHRLVSIRVAHLDGQPVGIARAMLRSLLLCLVIPAVVYDKDRRGLHDLASGTIVIRT